jgi:hypothetical protein
MEGDCGGGQGLRAVEPREEEENLKERNQTGDQGVCVTC